MRSQETVGSLMSEPERPHHCLWYLFFIEPHLLNLRFPTVEIALLILHLVLVKGQAGHPVAKQTIENVCSSLDCCTYLFTDHSYLIHRISSNKQYCPSATMTNSHRSPDQKKSLHPQRSLQWLSFSQTSSKQKDRGDTTSNVGQATAYQNCEKGFSESNGSDN